MAHKWHTDPDPEWAKLGRTLRRLRGDRSLRGLASTQPTGDGRLWLSFGSLGRFERGAPVPAKYDRHLDELYGAGDEVATEIQRLWRRPLPAEGQAVLIPPAQAVTHAPVTWESGYDGEVWLRLIGGPPTSTRVWLTWGPWRTAVDVLLDQRPVLVTGKSADASNRATPLLVSALVKLDVEHGVGPAPASAQVLDLHDRWQAYAPIE